MPHIRNRNWRREKARLNKTSTHTSPSRNGWPPKKWKHQYLRSTKLHRARQIGKIWPRKEWITLMKDSASIKILFVCSKNQWRSPTGETVFGKIEGVSTKSAGTSKSAKHKINVQDIRWADFILVMEEKHKSRIQAEFRDETRYKNLHVLDIPDDYQYMDEELIELLISKTNNILSH